MITPYLAQQPVDDFGFCFASLKYSSTLATTTDTLFTVPGAAQRYKAIIKATNTVWVANNAVAAAPVGAPVAAISSEMVLPYECLCREVKAGDVLHFFAPNASTGLSVVLYALNTNN